MAVVGGARQVGGVNRRTSNRNEDVEKGKPVARPGRKARGLSESAQLPK
jgi:hypothetical protein